MSRVLKAATIVLALSLAGCGSDGETGNGDEREPSPTTALRSAPTTVTEGSARVDDATAYQYRLARADRQFACGQPSFEVPEPPEVDAESCRSAVERERRAIEAIGTADPRLATLTNWSTAALRAWVDAELDGRCTYEALRLSDWNDELLTLCTADTTTIDLIGGAVGRNRDIDFGRREADHRIRLMMRSPDAASGAIRAAAQRCVLDRTPPGFCSL